MPPLTLSRRLQITASRPRLRINGYETFAKFAVTRPCPFRSVSFRLSVLGEEKKEEDEEEKEEKGWFRSKVQSSRDGSWNEVETAGKGGGGGKGRGGSGIVRKLGNWPMHAAIEAK